MDKYIKLKEYSQKLLKEHNIIVLQKDYDIINKQIALYIDSLIFNIVSISCIIAILNNKNTITNDTLKTVKKYIEKKCSFKYTLLSNKMTGGGDTFMTASYFGSPENMYNVNNKSEDILNVDFENGILRPQIGGANKLMLKNVKIVLKHINEILKYHDLKASKKIKEDFIHIINMHIKQLFKDLSKLKKKITLIELNKKIIKNKIYCPLK